MGLWVCTALPRPLQVSRHPDKDEAQWAGDCLLRSWPQWTGTSQRLGVTSEENVSRGEGAVVVTAGPS